MRDLSQPPDTARPWAGRLASVLIFLFIAVVLVLMFMAVRGPR